MTTYAWIIDTEYIDDSGDTLPLGKGQPFNVAGPSDANEVQLAHLRKGGGSAFRMYDDDGQLNLSGRIIVEDGGFVIKPWDADEFAAFGPLNDYGMGGYGCTELRYPMGDNGAWKTL
jgi:hypothetical protein